MTILDTHPGSLLTESGLRLAGSSTRQGVRSLQGRFEDVAEAASVVLVCLMIAENADGEAF
jgi:hypothetical protein